MRDFRVMPGAGTAGGGSGQGGKLISPQDIPLNVITLHPGGGALSHATPTGPGATGPGFEYGQPVRAASAGRLHKAGKR